MAAVYVTTIQDRQMLAMRDFYPSGKPALSKVYAEDMEPLEKSRIYGPFDNEVILWLLQQQRANGDEGSIQFVLGNDGVTGRPYLEY